MEITPKRYQWYFSSAGALLILMEIFPRRPMDIQEKIDKTNCLLRDFANSDDRITLLSLNDKLAPNSELNID